MAAVSSNKKPPCHARSVSLPSTLDPPSLFSNKFHSFQETTTSCLSTSSSIGHKLKDLNHLYESVEMLLALPTTQRSLAQGSCKQHMNKLLDELLELLDLCSVTKDALSTLMDLGKQLQSALRRKRGDDGELILSVKEYLSRRENVKVVVRKAISHLKKKVSSSTKEEDKHKTSNVDVLKEMESNTLMVFQSLLSFILRSNSQSKQRGWSSVVTSTFGHKNVQCDQTLVKDEVTEIGDELLALVRHKRTKLGRLDVEIIQKGLTEMEFSLTDLNEQVECIFRHFIKTRVSLLNIFT